MTTESTTKVKVYKPLSRSAIDLAEETFTHEMNGLDS